VHHYLIQLLENDQVVYSFSKFSQFYLNSQMPAELTEHLAGLPYEKTLTPQVIAVDSWFNQSEPVKGEPFTTPRYVPAQNVSAPVARLLDVVFQKDGDAKDISPLKNAIRKGKTAPETYFNGQQWAAKFTGNPDVYYKVDYHNNQKIKKAFTNTFSFETMYRANCSGHLSPLGAFVAETFVGLTPWAGASGAAIEQTEDGRINFLIRIGDRTRTVQCPVILNPGRYYHVVCTYEKTAGKAMIYIDGAKVGDFNAGTIDPVLPKNADDQRIGIGGNAFSNGKIDPPLNGEIAIARMYDRALSQDEIYLLYKNTIQIK
jgi:hypothetical protein